MRCNVLTPVTLVGAVIAADPAQHILSAHWRVAGWLWLHICHRSEMYLPQIRFLPPALADTVS